MLRALTSARVALGRAGSAFPTKVQLALQLAEASARDAVKAPLASAPILADLSRYGFTTLQVHSAAGRLEDYLRRPDWGRRLAPESAQLLAEHAAAPNARYDAVFVIADGLSATAVERHAVTVLALTASILLHDGWRIAPVVLAEHGRVALGDEIGGLLGADQAVILIGERPGLSASDSLGAYLTFDPRIGRTDAERNCISNIRPGGLAYAAAADTLRYLMLRARDMRRTGIELKDDRDALIGH